MPYPLSSPVTAGQPTASEHYNNLRLDALHLGAAEIDSKTLGGFLNRHAEHMTLERLDTTRVRVPHEINKPPTLMINGYMLQASANVDLPTGVISGAAATWYIFAVRSAESTTFTLTANTSSAEATDQRLIGAAVWTGSYISSVLCYFDLGVKLPIADYDSGWFAVTYNTTYSKAHGFGQLPRLVALFWSSSATGATENIPVFVVTSGSSPISILGFDSSVINATTGDSSSQGTLKSTRGNSAAGYYRMVAWK
jgi:hypothetical protein